MQSAAINNSFFYAVYMIARSFIRQQRYIDVTKIRSISRTNNGSLETDNPKWSCWYVFRDRTLLRGDHTYKYTYTHASTHAYILRKLHFALRTYTLTSAVFIMYVQRMNPWWIPDTSLHRYWPESFIIFPPRRHNAAQRWRLRSLYRRK